jgi:anti-sigma factor RsiW
VSACRQRDDLGPYVLGALAADDARRVEAHLRGCARCRGEHDEIAGAPALLALARRADPRPPEHLRHRVVAAAVRRHARRRWLATAAALVVLAGLAGGLVGSWAAQPGPVAVAVRVQGVEPFEAAGTVTFRPLDGRVAVDVDLEGLAPLDAPAVYEAWLSTPDGRVRSIGQLEVTDREGLRATVAAEGVPGDYRYFWLTAEPDARDPAHAGPTVVRAPVPVWPTAGPEAGE